MLRPTNKSVCRSHQKMFDMCIYEASLNRSTHVHAIITLNGCLSKQKKQIVTLQNIRSVLFIYNLIHPLYLQGFQCVYNIIRFRSNHIKVYIGGFYELILI